jgi:hypothetical protein
MLHSTHLAARLTLLSSLSMAACSSAVVGASALRADRPPVITAFTVPSADTVGAAVAVSGAARDPDGDALAYAWTATPAGCGTLADPAAASTTFTPVDAGSCTVRLTVTAKTLSATRSAAITSTAPAHAPTIDTFSVPATAVIGVGVAVASTASDPDGDPVTSAWTASPTGCGTFAAPAAASTTFTAAVGGTCTVRLTVTAAGQSTSRSQAVTVDRPPVIGTFTVPATARVGIGVAVTGAASDPDGDAVSYAWTASPGGCGAFTSATAASTTFTPATAGTCTVQLTVTARTLTAVRSQAVTVAADRAPVIGTFTVPATARVGVGVAVTSAASDPDGDTVTTAWTASPAGCGTFASATAASTTFTPAAAGTCTVQLTVTARALTAVRSQAVTVAANRAPVIGTFTVPSTATLGVGVAVTSAATDPDGDTVTSAWTASPTGCGTFAAATAASTTFTPAAAGTCTVRLTVSDGSLTATQTQAVAVAAADRPPVIGTYSVPSTATNGVGLSVSATASDPDGDAVSYAWAASPSGCGTFLSTVSASTTFTPSQVGTCTVQLTVTANGLTASRSTAVVVSAPCAGSCAGTLRAVDPLAAPPNGVRGVAVDTVARPQLWKDQNPSGSGDLFGIVRAGYYASNGAYYLLVSTDGGTSWSYLTASGGTAPAITGTNLYEQSLCQDTVGFRVHYVTFTPGDTNARYHRVALAYDGNHHISGWSWEASNVAGPPLSGAGVDYNSSARVLVQEVLDGAGNHVLLLTGLESPTAARVARLVATRTVAGATALAPTGTASWRRLTDANTAGNDVLCSKNTDASVDAAAFLNLINVGSYVRVHESDYTAAQLGADHSLHFLLGPMYYNDATAYGDIRRWRMTWSSGNWVNDAGVNGAVVAPTHSPNKPCLGGSKGTQNYAWFSWGDETGLHVSRVDASGTWTKDAVAQPDTSAANTNWWYAAINVSADETQLWAYWERISNSGGSYNDLRRFYSGGAWGASSDDTSLFNTPSAGAYGSASAWAPIGGMTQGIGVMSYGYTDWNTTTPHYHIHVVQ